MIGVLVYSFARIGPALAMDATDIFKNQSKLWLQLKEKGGRQHQMPLHHSAEKYLREYMDAPELWRVEGRPLFCTLDVHRELTDRRLQRREALATTKRRAKRAGFSDAIGNHTFRATGIATYMKNGGTLETAQQMAAHASSRTTNM